MSSKRDLSGFAAPGGLPAPPPPPPAAPAVAPVAEGARAHPVPAPDAAPRPTARTPRSNATRSPAEGRRPDTKADSKADAKRVGGGRPGRRRICVSLTLDASDQLSGLAQDRRSWKVEVILEALHNWEERLRDRQEPGPARFRRRRSATPTPFVMDLTPGELDRLDGLAQTVGLSRSALVRRLIELEAGPDGPADSVADGQPDGPTAAGTRP